MPSFGDWFTGIYASEDNPHRHGMYVRTIRRTGRMNRGTHYELTDGHGAFFEYPVASVVPRSDPPVAEVIPVAVLRAKLAEMELHDNLPDSYDMGFMSAWREMTAFVAEHTPSTTGTEPT